MKHFFLKIFTLSFKQPYLILMEISYILSISTWIFWNFFAVLYPARSLPSHISYFYSVFLLFRLTATQWYICRKAGIFFELLASTATRKERAKFSASEFPHGYNKQEEKTSHLLISHRTLSAFGCLFLLFARYKKSAKFPSKHLQSESMEYYHIDTFGLGSLTLSAHIGRHAWPVYKSTAQFDCSFHYNNRYDTEKIPLIELLYKSASSKESEQEKLKCFIYGKMCIGYNRCATST